MELKKIQTCTTGMLALGWQRGSNVSTSKILKVIFKIFKKYIFLNLNTGAQISEETSIAWGRGGGIGS